MLELYAFKQTSKQAFASLDTLQHVTSPTIPLSTVLHDFALGNRGAHFYFGNIDLKSKKSNKYPCLECGSENRVPDGQKHAKVTPLLK